MIELHQLFIANHPYHVHPKESDVEWLMSEIPRQNKELDNVSSRSGLSGIWAENVPFP